MHHTALHYFTLAIIRIAFIIAFIDFTVFRTFVTPHLTFSIIFCYTPDPSNLTPKKVNTQLSQKEIDSSRVAMNIIEVDGVHR